MYIFVGYSELLTKKEHIAREIVPTAAARMYNIRCFLRSS